MRCMFFDCCWTWHTTLSLTIRALLLYLNWVTLFTPQCTAWFSLEWRCIRWCNVKLGKAELFLKVLYLQPTLNWHQHPITPEQAQCSCWWKGGDRIALNPSWPGRMPPPAHPLLAEDCFSKDVWCLLSLFSPFDMCDFGSLLTDRQINPLTGAPWRTKRQRGPEASMASGCWALFGVHQ